jgi:hypothetical protein
MMNNSGFLVIFAVLLAFMLPAATAQSPQQSVTANLCEVAALPDRYNGKVLSVEGILQPVEHSVLLYSPS